MGDASDFADVGRFMRSKEGQRALDRFQQSLLNKVICDVTFCHLSTGVSITLHFADGGHLDITVAEQAFAVESLRDRYAMVLEREYHVDFPERKPGGPAAPQPFANTLETLRLVCPVCGDREAFAIETHQCLTVYQDGTITGGDEGQQWDTDSPCRCDACDHEGVVQDFVAETKP
ncbi:MAG: hypothetical protein GC168_00090 [Candidatus Hydrogenedens sp.]|nr:hypothetical protein [Candidatus Hydrogenedens sp.]